MIFFNALAVFVILAGIWYGWAVISSLMEMTPAMRFFSEGQAGVELRKAIAAIVIATLWLIFGN